MRYVILIAGDEAASLCHPDGEIVAKYQKYTEDLQQAGVLLGGEAFEPSNRGVRISIDGRKRNVTDGPFSEAKEVIGGYYQIQVKSKEEAIEWAARCPGAQFPGRSYVELREVMEFGA